ncbi:pentatricopeptide repeat-containing protein At3g29230-like isoform X2 [Wolffia australiana]
MVSSLLGSCKSERQLKEAHGQVIKRDPWPFQSSAASLFLSAYAVSSHGNLDIAMAIFYQMQRPSTFACNSIIRGLAAGKKPANAVLVFSELLRRGFQPNNFTFPFLLKSCAEASLMKPGASIHGLIVKSGQENDCFIRSTLIRFYARGHLADARKVFDECSRRESVSWNSMIDGYVKAGELGEARFVFDRMISRDTISWNTMINGYVIFGDLHQAKNLFQQMPSRSIVSWNSILAGHAKCGDLSGALKVFEEMPKRDVVSWNAMLACYSQSGKPREALELFDLMRRERVKPTDATIVSLLSACGLLGALDQGKAVESFMREQKVQPNTILGTALVDMYAKCGDIEQAEEVFQSLEERDVLAWNTMIAATGMHGQSQRALHLFEEMEASGLPPDDITFVAVLGACSHGGDVERGRLLLNSMEKKYGIKPKLEHYGCLIDLLARAGYLEEALEVIESMPMEPNPGAWGALLGGCKIHGNIRVAEAAGLHLLKLQPNHSGRKWEEAGRVRQMMEARCIVKSPGLSLVDKGSVIPSLETPEIFNLYLHPPPQGWDYGAQPSSSWP